MKRLVMAVALACALSMTTLAGEIHSTAPTPPPPPSSPVAVQIILTILSIVGK